MNATAELLEKTADWLDEGDHWHQGSMREGKRYCAVGALAYQKKALGMAALNCYTPALDALGDELKAQFGVPSYVSIGMINDYMATDVTDITTAMRKAAMTLREQWSDTSESRA